MTHFDRSAGVLLHVTSLPGKYGVGDLGSGARDFVDFLVDAGQKIWQLLPVGPTIQCESPYSCYSAFAGNPLLISGEELVRDGFLDQRILDELPAANNADSQADYAHAHKCNTQILQAAYHQYRNQAACHLVDEFESFCVHQRDWLDPFALFAALMGEFNTDNWTTWPEEIRTRQPDAVGEWRDRLGRSVEYQQFVQYMFYTQWDKLKRYAANKGVKLFGDMPIFVAHGSSDVWAHQDQFHLEPTGHPSVVAGVPPDYFSKTGQLWGNPLYNWEAMAQNRYHWWSQRFKVAFELYDLLRIDHFRGFEAYWEVPASEETAIIGKWVDGPKNALFEVIQKTLGPLPVIAENLGVITPEVTSIMEAFEFPGMAILQFAFDSDASSEFLPHNYSQHLVAYTGTHDNDTLRGWWYNDLSTQDEETVQQARNYARKYLALDNFPEQDLHWTFNRALLASVANLAILPLQDVIGLGEEGRMNTPGTVGGQNWSWRFTFDMIPADAFDRLGHLTRIYGRVVHAQETSVSVD